MTLARTFTLADQRDFAALSGDWNLLHVDPIAARRTLLGAPVVHGIHLVLWALEHGLAGVAGDEVVLDSVRAVFRNPAYLDREVTARFDGATIEVREGELVVLELAFEARAGVHATIALPAAPELARDPLERTFDDAASARGELELALDVAHAARVFPRCLGRLGAAAIAELLATTRLVGMVAPGLHSLYAGVTLRASDGVGRSLGYEVAKATERYSSIALRVRGPTWTGTLDTFYRPPPARIAFDDVVRLVAPGEYAGQRALVIGGSRGLGEAIVKALAVGGARVAFTYRVGEADAERIASELAARGLHARAFAYDALSPHELAERRGAEPPPTHLYYLAAPPVRSDRELATRVLATGLHDTVAAIVALGAGSPASPLVVWAPSMTLLEGTSGPPALRDAKLAMEATCAALPAQLPVIVHAPRLPRFASDHSAALIRAPLASPVTLAVEALRTLSR